MLVNVTTIFLDKNIFVFKNIRQMDYSVIIIYILDTVWISGIKT